jgi:hypothetical protein
MMDRCYEDVVRDVRLLGRAPKGSCRPCAQCGDLAAEHVIRMCIVGEKFTVWLCSPCASGVMEIDLEAEAISPDKRDCEYVDIDVLELCYGRRIADYR